MKQITIDILEAVLGESVQALNNGIPVLASGQPLTAAQKRAIAPLVEHGVPETIDAEAIDFEASRRMNAIVPQRSRELLQTNGLAACVAAIDALAADNPLPQSYLDARANLALVAQVSAIETAATAIKTQDPLPADYLALVAAFDAALS